MNTKNQVRPPAARARWRLGLSLSAVAILVAAPTAAQVSSDEVWSDEIPAHLSVVEGTATLERDGLVERAEPNLILLAGDRLRTDRGRIEILFADGSAVAIDEYATVDLLDASLMRLIEGRVRVSIARATGSLEYRVDTVAGSALLLAAGDYRISLTGLSAESAEVDLGVLRGSAELVNEFGRTLVRAGTHAVTRATTAPSLPYTLNSARRDAFDVWADDQRDARLGYESTRYLPADLRYDAGVFDRYGSWGYEPSYGYVWYPTVDVGWRPYSVGRWSFTAHFGWFWVGTTRWSWTTHHYGRWGVNRGRWYWIPDYRWSPAWVSWATAPGYVGWCPLGFDGRPVFSVTTISIRYADPWFGWTVMPSTVFAPNVQVARHAVPRGQAVPRTWSQFALDRAAPVQPAIQASQAGPLRSPGARVAVPRSAGTGTSTVPRLAAGAAAADTGRRVASGRSASGATGTSSTRGIAAPRATTSPAPAAGSRVTTAPRATAPASRATTRGVPATSLPGRTAGGSAASQATGVAGTSRRATSRDAVSGGTSPGTIRPSTTGSGTSRPSAPTVRSRAVPAAPRATLPSPSSTTRGTASTGSRSAVSRSGGVVAPGGRATTAAPSRSTPSSAGRAPGGTSRSTGALPSPGARRGSVTSRPSAAPPASSRVGGAVSRSTAPPATSRSSGGGRAAPPTTSRSSGGGRAAPPSSGGGGGRTASRRGGGGGGGV